MLVRTLKTGEAPIKRIQGLNILRIYAFFMVVACHTMFLDSLSGGVGNKIFFVMGGCLSFFSVAGPLGDREFSLKGMVDYYIKRLIRIIPSYWVIILFAWRLCPDVFYLRDFSTNNSLILNMLFFRAYGHLWFMQQIMCMYLLAPVIVFIFETIRRKIFSDKKIGYLINILILAVIAFLEKRYFTADIIAFSGTGTHSQFLIWMFFIGIGVAYACLLLKDIRLNRVVCDIYLVGIIALFTITSIPSVSEKYVSLCGLLQGEVLRSAVFGLSILLFYLSEDSLLGRVSENRAVKFLGDSAFLIYLIHFFLLGPLSMMSQPGYFLATLIISILLALVLHVVIEIPMEKLRKRIIG